MSLEMIFFFRKKIKLLLIFAFFFIFINLLPSFIYERSHNTFLVVAESAIENILMAIV